ncbi:MAG: PH domain-containing protein, partial [Bdellovibrionales bacterium]|jgi:membrane protein YdbS with pleckstrin-like domain|nr:PH domain-containing protein [Bdellovibrionales bacterium]
LLLVFLSPEAAQLGAKLWDLPAFVSYVAGIFIVFMLVIAPQFFVAYINCRFVHYDFYPDHLSFIENIILRDPIRVHYRSVAALRTHKTMLQKRLGLGDIVIESRPARHLDLAGVDHVIEDVRASEKQKMKIEKIIAAWQAAQDMAVQASSGASTAAGKGDTDKR